MKSKDKDQEPLFYLGLGASAGGLEALEKFFQAMPADSGLTFVVVQHLSPDYKSLMVELLSRQTKMVVERAEEGMALERDHVYLIPPKKNMTIKDGKLHLKEQNLMRGLNLPIDIFLRSLALDKRNRSIAIIFSGTGSDGTMGVRSIKEREGMVMVQTEASAKFDGMPRSAIATGLVDYTLPPEQMPAELMKYIKHPFVVKEKSDSSLIGTDFLGKVLSIIRSRTKGDFTSYKPNTIVRRLERRLSINQIENPEEYLELLKNSPYEVKVLYKEILIGVTQFFRDSEAFKILETEVVPQLFEDRSPDSPIRVWSAACSSGEEAYSLAMLMHEYIETHELPHTAKIFATDLDKDAIDIASIGIYPESIANDMSKEFLAKYFRKIPEGGYQVKEKIRRMVVFAQHNLIKDPPFSKIDMVSCRNLLIYLKPEMQQKVLAMFHFSLRKSGFLFLGSSENLGNLADVFEVINSKWKVYRYSTSSRMPISRDLMLPVGAKADTHDESDVLVPYSKGVSAELFDRLLHEFVPPSILVDDQNNIVHFFRDIDKFIRFSYGKATFNILKVIRPELSMVLGGILHKVRKENREFKYTDISLEEKGEQFMVDVVARPLFDSKKSLAFTLVSFVEPEVNARKEHVSIDDVDVSSQMKDRIMDLERQLESRSENLQTTIEELETSNEELQATNEELIASNEELQSTNEELQSVNEELFTVNSEFQSKIQELTSLNNDMNNLLNNTQIGTLFLDKNLNIRKFTPVINRIFRIKEIDIGRSITDFSLAVSHTSFFDDLRRAVNRKDSHESQVKDPNGNWCSLRIDPYITSDEEAEGVIITLTDVTDRVTVQRDLLQARHLLESQLTLLPTTDIYLFSARQFCVMDLAQHHWMKNEPKKAEGLPMSEIFKGDFFAKIKALFETELETIRQLELSFENRSFTIITSGRRFDPLGELYVSLSVTAR